MDPLHFFIGAAPVAVYLFLVGMINLSRKPFLTTGARDIAALGVAISGLIIAGPMELFLPEAAVNRFGPWVWLMSIAFFGLCLSLVVLLLRPRLIIYNVSSEQLRPLLAKIVSQVDKDARWAGESLILPNLEVQLHVEVSHVLRNVQLVSSGAIQNFAGWRQLEHGIAGELRTIRAKPGPYGAVLVLASVIIAAGTAIWMASDYPAVAQSLSDMLRL